jgi:hypothetical protein
MTKWLKLFNIERRCAVSGADVPNLFEQGGFAEIEEHALEDVDLCEELVQKLHENQRL